jgi:hypothetical protein
VKPRLPGQEPERIADVSRAERRRGDLGQKRREREVVPPVDERPLNNQ